MGFKDGDKILSIDDQAIVDVNEIRQMLLLTKEDRHVVVERAGEQVDFTIPFDELLAMRRNKEYEDLYMLRVPFVIDSVASESALAAGLQSGDEVVECNSRQDIDVVTMTEDILPACKGDTAVMTVVRAGERVILNVPVNEEGKIGIKMKSGEALFAPRTRTFTLFEAIPAGVNMAVDTVVDYWEQLKLIFQPKTKMYEELGGFISIGNIFPSEWNWLRFWSMTAFLSVMLAVLNILPIPGLDGGHALFTLWEVITGRKASDKFLEIMQYIGFAILLALVIYSNGNDIYRLFTN